MKKTIRKLTIIFAAALMVMMMAAPSFAATISANVHFVTYNTVSDTLQDKWGQSYTITPVNVTVPVSFNTTGFSSIIPNANSSYHQYMSTPTVMDAIYKAYDIKKNNIAVGWTSGWDTLSTPNGAYVTEIFGNPEITQHLTSHHWDGYAWKIYLNPVNWTTNNGELQVYASNVVLSNNDEIYVLYDQASENF